MKLIQKLIISSIVSAIGLAGCHSGGSNQQSGVQAPPIDFSDDWIPDGFYKNLVENIVYDQQSGILSGHLKDKTKAGYPFVPEQKDRFITFDYRGLCNPGSEVDLENVYDPIWKSADIYVRMKCTSPRDVGHGNYDPLDRNKESRKYYLGVSSTYFYDWHGQTITGFEWIEPYDIAWGNFSYTTWQDKNQIKILNLEHANANHANFRDSVWLNSVTFWGSTMSNANFTGAMFLNHYNHNPSVVLAVSAAGGDNDAANFDGAYLKYADLINHDRILDNDPASFFSVSFRYAHLDNAILASTYTFNSSLHGDYRYADFTGASLTNADFTNGDAGKAIFVGANLTGTNFYYAYFPNANFHGADLSKAKLDYTGIDEYSRVMGRYPDEWMGTDFTSATLLSASLLKANFKGSDFSDAALNYASINGSNLKNASFRNAKLYNANLKGSAIEGADFSGAKLGDTVWVDGMIKTGICAESSIGRCDLIPASSSETSK